MSELFDEYSGMIIAAQSLFIAIAFAFNMFMGADSLVSYIVNIFCRSLGLY